MYLHHLAIWTRDLELVRDFYTRYFGMQSGGLYTNPKKQYRSYFLEFPGSGTRLELMHRPDIAPSDREKGDSFGLTHFSISTGSREKVDELTEILRRDGYQILSEARTTGDGYYESAIADPEGNIVEICE